MARRIVFLSVVLVALLSGCALLEAVDGRRLATRTIIIASCLERVAPGSAAAGIARDAATDAQAAAARLVEARDVLGRAGTAMRLIAPYVEDGHLVGPRVVVPWSEFADRAARAQAFQTDGPVDPPGLFDLAHEALGHLDDAIEAYDRVRGDDLAMQAILEWAGYGASGDARVRRIVRQRADPEAAAGDAFMLPDRDAEVGFYSPLMSLRSALEVENDAATVHQLKLLANASQSTFWMDGGGGVVRSVGDIVARIDHLEAAAETWEQGTLERAARAEDDVVAELARAEHAARNHPECLPTGPLVTDVGPSGGVAPVASPVEEVAAPGG